MKKSVFNITLATVAAAGCLAVLATPANAQGARFVYAPNTWGTEQTPKKSRYLQQMQPMTSVGHGSMPKGSTFLGVDPTMLPKKPQPAPQVQTNAFPTMTAGSPRVMPQQKPAPFNPAFGAPPALAMHNPAPVPNMTAPNSQFGSPHTPQTTSQGVSARMQKPAQPIQRHAIANRGGSSRSVRAVMRAPAKPSALAAAPKVLGYNNNAYSSGSTKPVSSGYSSTTSLSGQIIRHH